MCLTNCVACGGVMVLVLVETECRPFLRTTRSFRGYRCVFTLSLPARTQAQSRCNRKSTFHNYRSYLYTCKITVLIIIAKNVYKINKTRKSPSSPHATMKDQHEPSISQRFDRTAAIATANIWTTPSGIVVAVLHNLCSHNKNDRTRFSSSRKLQVQTQPNEQQLAF